MLRKGLVLLTLWAAYELLSFLYFSLLWASETAVLVGGLLGIGFLALWFCYGYKLRLGWANGLRVGIIGAAPGWLPLVGSLVILLASGTRDGGPFWLMLPWSFPLLGLMDLMPVRTQLMNYVPHLSALLAIVLTGLGSSLGARQKRSVAA